MSNQLPVPLAYNPDLLSIMPEAVGRVLEFGCNDGALGKAYKEKFPDTHYISIEINPDAAAKASQHVDKIVNGDCEKVEVIEQALDGQPVDCIVYGDVLEHLHDPWAALKLHSSYLTKNGVVAACIPNIQHWTIINNLFHGYWEYQDSGILDRTHLRFFTHRSVRALFEGAGLFIDFIRGRRPGKDQFPQFLEAMKPVLPRLNVDEKIFAEAASIVQFVVRATRND